MWKKKKFILTFCPITEVKLAIIRWMVGELFDVSTAHKLMKMMIFENSRFKLGLKIKNAEFAGLN